MLQHLDNNVEEDVLKILRGIVKMEPNVTSALGQGLSPRRSSLTPSVNRTFRSATAIKVAKKHSDQKVSCRHRF